MKHTGTEHATRLEHVHEDEWLAIPGSMSHVARAPWLWQNIGPASCESRVGIVRTTTEDGSH